MGRLPTAEFLITFKPMIWIVRIGAGLLALAAIALLGFWLWLHARLPSTNGDVTLDALTDDVEVVRDAHGVPHIFAPRWREAYVALGFLHAQDRLLQMELTRRMGAGTLAEVVGEPALKNDKLMRTLGLYQAAADSYFSLSTPVQTALQAYADGVNAYMQHETLPAEFALLGITPRAWEPADSLVWLKLMAHTLGSGWRRELTAAALAGSLSENSLPENALNTLFDWPETPLARAQQLKENNPKTTWSADSFGALLAALPAPPIGSNSQPATASNAWAATDRRSSTGGPLLANDPHLLLSSPVVWYLARIETPEGSLVGATAPGVPFHVMGMNNELAWGLTTTGADVSDVYIEKIGNVPELYITPNGPEAFLTRHEVIKVKGQKDVNVKVRQTRHGPVIGGLVDNDIAEKDSTISLSATYLRGDDTSAEALYWMGRARTVAELEMALRFVQAPVQNVTFAERRGNIGRITAGTIPVRGSGTKGGSKDGAKSGNGAYPAPGHDPAHDWTGIVPRHDLPRIINPGTGALGNANEAVVDDNYPYLVTSHWDEGWRGHRLQQLLDTPGLFSAADFSQWQNDTLDLPVMQLRDQLLELLGTEKLPARLGNIITTLRDWDGHDTLTSTAPTIMAVWQEQLASALLHDDLKDKLALLRPISINLLFRLLADQKYDWCDDRTTETRENCADMAASSLQATVDELQGRFGSDPDDWQWRKLNIATLENRFWQNIPFFGALVDTAGPVSGGQYTLLRSGRIAATGSDDLYSVRHGAGFRGVYDLVDPAASQFVLTTGQSGHPFSSHYDDQLSLWRGGKYITLSGTLHELQQAGGDYLTLRAPEGDDADAQIKTPTE